MDETPSGAILKTPSRRSIAAVYLADWDSLDVSLAALRVRGWTSEADAAHTDLSRLTSKVLTQKNPTMPTEDAVAHWHELRPILASIADLYAAAE